MGGNQSIHHKDIIKISRFRRNQKETDVSRGWRSGRHDHLVSLQSWQGAAEGQQRDTIQTPEDLRKRNDVEEKEGKESCGA